jgi:hypothetical protein
MEFWNTLTEEEKEIGLSIIFDSELAEKYKDTPLYSFVYDTELQKLALEWAENQSEK